MPTNIDKDVLDIVGQRLGQGYVTVWPSCFHKHVKAGVVDDLERAATFCGPTDKHNTVD